MAQAIADPATWDRFQPDRAGAALMLTLMVLALAGVVYLVRRVWRTGR